MILSDYEYDSETFSNLELEGKTLQAVEFSKCKFERCTFNKALFTLPEATNLLSTFDLIIKEYED